MDYKKAYYTLFNGITDAVGVLIEKQKETEEMYVNSENNLILLNDEDGL